MPVLRQGKCLDPLLLANWCECLASTISPSKRIHIFFAELLSSLSDHAMEGDDLTSDFRGELVTQLSQSMSSNSSEHSDWLSEGRSSWTLGQGGSVSGNVLELWRDTLVLYHPLGCYQWNRTSRMVRQIAIDGFQYIGLHSCGRG